jgi:hypothetical protein
MIIISLFPPTVASITENDPPQQEKKKRKGRSRKNQLEEQRCMQCEATVNRWLIKKI